VNDVKGDEGDIFSRFVHGEAISNTELAELQQENDSGTIEINGEKVEVEFGCCKSLRKAFKKIGDGFKKLGKSLKKYLEKVKRKGSS